MLWIGHSLNLQEKKPASHLNLPCDFEDSGVQKRSSFSWKIDEHPWLQIAPPRTHWVAISCQCFGLHSETSLLQTHHISTNLGHLWCEILGAVLGGPSPTCFTVHPNYRRWVGLKMIASLLSEFKHSSYFILYTFPKSNKQNNKFSAFSLFSHDSWPVLFTPISAEPGYKSPRWLPASWVTTVPEPGVSMATGDF